MRFGGKLQSIGSNLTAAITLPLAAIGVAAVKSGMQFESAMNSIQGVLRPTTSQMDDLRAMALKMGADTAFSATDAATAMLELGKAGFSVTDTLSSVDEVMQLAAASGLSMGEAAELSARAIAAFGLQAEDLAHVNDVLAGAVNASTLSIQDLQVAFGYVGGIAQGFGMSIEQVSAALAVMRDRGIGAETAGRALREGMGRLANPVKAVREVMDELGVDSFQQTNGSLVDLSEIVGILQEKGLTAAQSLKLFGDAAGPGMYQLVRVGSGALDDMTSKLALSQGAAQGMADAMMRGLPGAFEYMAGSIDTAFIQISKALTPALIPIFGMVGALADVVTNQLVPAFTALPVPVQITAIALTGIAAAAGPAMFALGSLFNASGSLIGGWRILFGTVSADGVRSMGLLTTAMQGVSTWMTRLALVDAAITARGMATLAGANALVGQSFVVMGARSVAATASTAAAGVAARITAVSQGVLTAATTLLGGSALLTGTRMAVTTAATTAMGVAARAGSLAVGMLSAGYTVLRTVIAGLLGPIGLFIAALYAANQAMTSDAGLKWLATSDAMPARLMRWAGGHEKLTEAQANQAIASMRAKESADGMATSMQTVADRVNALRQQLKGGELDVQALTQVHRELIAEQNKSPEASAAVVVGLKQVAQQAAGLKAQGYELDPALEGLVKQFDRMKPSASGAAQGIDEAKEAAKQAAARVKDLRDELTGVKKISDASDTVKALAGVDVSTLPAETQERINHTLVDGIEALKVLKREAPAAMKALAAATMPVLQEVGDSVQNVNSLFGDMPEAIRQASMVNAPLPPIITELPTAEENLANIASLAGQVGDEFQAWGEIQAPKAIDQWMTGLSQILDAVSRLPGLLGSIGAALSGALSGGGQIGTGLKQLMKPGERLTGVANTIAGMSDAALSIWENTNFKSTAGKIAGGAASGAMTGAAIGSVVPGLGTAVGAGVGAGVGALVGFVRSRIVSQDEKDARKEALTFQNELLNGFLATASASQLAEAQGEKWRLTNIAVRDAYLAIGKSEADAMRDLETFNNATRISAEAVQAAAAVIGSAFDEHAADQQRLNDAIKRYGFEWEELGQKFQQTTLNNQAKELIEDWRVLVASGIAVETVNTRMASSMNEYLQAALAVGAEVPMAMKPILQSFADQGLLVDAAGNKITDLSAAGVTFAETMAQGFDRIIVKLDQLINSLIAAGTAIDPLSGGLVSQAQANTGASQATAPSSFSDWFTYYRSQGEGGFTALPKAMQRVAEGATIPSFANEGIVDSPTLAVIGDAPEPEMVLRKSTVEAIAAGGRKGGGRQIILNFHGAVIGAGREAEAFIVRAVNKALQEDGEAWGEHERIVQQMARS